jgi:hypothetical protein
VTRGAEVRKDECISESVDAGGFQVQKKPLLWHQGHASSVRALMNPELVGRTSTDACLPACLKCSAPESDDALRLKYMAKACGAVLWAVLASVLSNLVAVTFYRLTDMTSVNSFLHAVYQTRYEIVKRSVPQLMCASTACSAVFDAHSPARFRILL